MKKLSSLYAVALFCCATFDAQANAIITNPGPGMVVDFTANVNAGYDFTVGSTSLMVTALGLWDGPELIQGNLTGSAGDGFASEHVIGLWDNSGNLLAKAVMQIGTGDTLINGFRYSSALIPINPGPVILSANTTYVLGAAFIANDPDTIRANLSGNQATFDLAVIPGNARGSFGSFSFPSLNDGPGSYVGPNALFTVANVPEGGNALLMMSGAVAVVFALRFVMSSTRRV